MEQIPSFGSAIKDHMGPSMKLYEPLVLKNAAAIRATERKTFSYGPHERQTLDVYYPARTSATSPVLIFFHGGGFQWGAKVMQAPGSDKDFAEGLVYTNLGHFFAEKHGFIIVIPNYLLDRHGARFPSGGKDYSLAVKWAEGNLAKDGKRDLYLMGSSAGAVHMTTFLFHPDFSEQVKQLAKREANATSGLKLTAAVSLSGPLQFETILPYRAEVINRYFLDDVKNNVPTALVQQLMDRGEPVAPGVRLLIVDCEFDPEDEIIDPSRKTAELIGKTRDCDKLYIPGHNHISPVLALGTGLEKDEAWGHTVAQWLKM